MRIHSWLVMIYSAIDENVLFIMCSQITFSTFYALLNIFVLDHLGTLMQLEYDPKNKPMLIPKAGADYTVYFQAILLGLEPSAVSIHRIQFETVAPLSIRYLVTLSWTYS